MRRFRTVIASTVNRLFSRHLFVTNTVLTVILSATGDGSVQGYERYRGQQMRWDCRRTLHVGSTGLVIGPAAHFWYTFLERILPGRTVAIIAKKLLLDQTVFTPLYITAFFVVIAALEGASVQALTHDLHHKGSTMLLADWLVWPPAQVINFSLFPARFRVLYDNAVSLGFDCYSSYIKYRT